MELKNLDIVSNLLPSILNLELTNACNLECIFCDYSNLKKTMEIKELDCNMLEKILDDVKGIHIYELGLVGLGEPLLDKKLDKHLNIITAYKNNFERISLNTNAGVLDINKSELICESPINFITFSLNATSKDSYLKLMRRDKYDIVLKNIKMFLKIRKMYRRNDIKVNIQILSSNLNEIQTLKEDLSNYMNNNIFIFVRDMYNKPVFANITKEYFNITIKNTERRYPCWSIFSRIYIDVNGYLYPCTIGNDCYRENSSFMIGNVKNDSVISLFNSELILHARQRSIESKLPFPECSSCNIWSLLPNNFEWDISKNIWAKNDQQLRLKQYDPVSSDTYKMFEYC